jgi:hypothetical protein
MWRFRTYQQEGVRDIPFVVYPGCSVMALPVVTAFEICARARQ